MTALTTWADLVGWWVRCYCGHVSGPDDSVGVVTHHNEVHAAKAHGTTGKLSPATPAGTEKGRDTPMDEEFYDEVGAPADDSADDGPAEPMLEGTVGVDVSVVGINGEWLRDDLDLGDQVKLEVFATVVAAGEKLQGGDVDKPSKRFVKLDVNGVEVVG